jgi:hypothetical protein
VAGRGDNRGGRNWLEAYILERHKEQFMDAFDISSESEIEDLIL